MKKLESIKDSKFVLPNDEMLSITGGNPEYSRSYHWTTNNRETVMDETVTDICIYF